MLLYQGKLSEAEAAFRKVTTLALIDANDYLNLGSVLQKQGKHPEAVEIFQKAITREPKYGRAYVHLGEALWLQRKLPEAEKAYRQALGLEPDLAEAHCNLGLVLLYQGRFAEATREMTRGQELGSLRPGWRNPQAEFLRMARRLAELDARLHRFLKGEAQPADAESASSWPGSASSTSSSMPPPLAGIARPSPSSQVSPRTCPLDTVTALLAPPHWPAADRARTRAASATWNAPCCASRPWTGCELT